MACKSRKENKKAASNVILGVPIPTESRPAPHHHHVNETAWLPLPAVCTTKVYFHKVQDTQDIAKLQFCFHLVSEKGHQNGFVDNQRSNRDLHA